MPLELAQTTGRIGSPLLGVVIPAIVFVFAFWITWLLYRHFSRRPPR